MPIEIVITGEQGSGKTLITTIIKQLLTLCYQGNLPTAHISSIQLSYLLPLKNKMKHAQDVAFVVVELSEHMIEQQLLLVTEDVKKLYPNCQCAVYCSQFGSMHIVKHRKDSFHKRFCVIDLD